MSSEQEVAAAQESNWLMRYYATRAGFSTIWVAVAFILGKSLPPLAAALLVVYPAWDALANLWDASRNGGLGANPTQAFNTFVSTIVTVAVGVALGLNAHTAFYVFGVWASLAGLLQLATAIRRWRGVSAQWPMILSGAQSTLAGLFFVTRGLHGLVPAPKDIAPYAAFGALYFAISAGVLALSAIRHRRVTAASSRYQMLD